MSTDSIIASLAWVLELGGIEVGKQGGYRRLLVEFEVGLGNRNLCCRIGRHRWLSLLGEELEAFGTALAEVRLEEQA
jgi:hypothetical protein